MNCIFTLFSSCTTSTNFVERRDGLVVKEEMVEENAHLEFSGNVCFKTASAGIAGGGQSIFVHQTWPSKMILVVGTVTSTCFVVT
jgi:hypothetical protein